MLEAFDPTARPRPGDQPGAGLRDDRPLARPGQAVPRRPGRKPVAGKSGTTEAYTGSIFIGYTPTLAVAASLMHIDAGPKCKSGYAYLATNFPPSGWQCPTSVLFGENVGISVWKPFLEDYYKSHPWPAMWTQPPGVVTREVCPYDGGFVTTGGVNEIFLKGIGEPNYPCGANPPPGAPPYVAARRLRRHPARPRVRARRPGSLVCSGGVQPGGGDRRRDLPGCSGCAWVLLERPPGQRG